MKRSGRLPASKQLQNPLHLSKDALLRSPLIQFLFELRREHLQEFIVVRDEGKLQVGCAQNKRIASGAIFYRTAKVLLEAILWFSRPPEFDALGIQPPLRAAAAEFCHECENRIDQQRRRRVFSGKGPGDLDKNLIAFLGDPKFFGAAKLFVAGQSLDGFAIGSGV
jgi:hypothetical protein